LPWWSFALGAAGFALLLAVDTGHRHTTWGQVVGAGKRITTAPAAVGVIGLAMTVALAVGASVTVVGTSRPSTASDHAKMPINGIGLSPFTSLRGQLTTGDAVPLLQIH